MDWTGGTRRRYAPRGKQNEVLQKQKAHFARVRAAADPQDFCRQSRHYQPPMLPHQYADMDREEIRTRRSNSHFDVAAGDHDTSERRSRGHHQRPRTHGKSLSRSSRSKSSRDNSLKRQIRHHNTFCGQPRSANMTEEEQLLLANRERLLARTDWLGLSASRPARYSFPSSRDKDRIGKRHKIVRARTPRLQPRERTPVSSVFGRKFTNRDHMMRGALQEEINIKVGTDAFASQTQPSQHARTLINTSLRPPSTEFGPLSEESMLARVDEDGFERYDDTAYSSVLRQPDPNPVHSLWQASTQEVDRADASTENQNTFPSHARHSTMPATESLMVDDESFEDLEAGLSPGWVDSNEPPDGQVNDEMCQSPAAVSCCISDTDLLGAEEDTIKLIKRYRQLTSSRQPIVTAQPSSLHVAQATTDDRDLNSSRSLYRSACVSHANTSLASVTAPLNTPAETYDIRPQVRVTEGNDTHLFMNLLSSTNKPPAYSAIVGRDIPASVSPSTSRRSGEEAHDNAIWREFVIGSQAGESEHSVPTNRSRMDLWRDSDPVLPTHITSSTDLARSDKATMAPTELSDEGCEKAVSEYPTHTSMIAHATTVHPGYGQGEDPPPSHHGPSDADESRSFTTGNLHVSSIAIGKQERLRKWKH